MVLHAVVGKSGVFCVGAAVVGVGVDADAAAGREQARYLNILRIHQGDEVFHNLVHTVFVEIAVIAEGEQIEFQALALNHLLVGDIGNADLCKIGLTGDGAERRKFGAIEPDPIIIIGMLVEEGLEQGGVVVGGVFCLFGAEQAQVFVFSGGHSDWRNWRNQTGQANQPYGWGGRLCPPANVA